MIQIASRCCRCEPKKKKILGEQAHSIFLSLVTENHSREYLGSSAAENRGRQGIIGAIKSRYGGRFDETYCLLHKQRFDMDFNPTAATVYTIFCLIDRSCNGPYSCRAARQLYSP